MTHPTGGPARVSVRGRAYPWDVLGDPAFPGRLDRLGVDEVAVAAAYHSVRAATPWHPRHLVVTAGHAALYRRVDPAVWTGRRLVPAEAGWLPEPDPFGSATAALAGRGVAVTAWVVLTHATRLGEAAPDVAVVNCFGERYSYALCPSHAEVRDYAATLAAESIRDAPVSGVCLEACGQLGVEHGSHHDKTAGGWGPAAARLLSVCCCLACRRGWTARGLDPEEVVAALRHETRRLITDESTEEPAEAPAPTNRPGSAQPADSANQPGPASRPGSANQPGSASRPPDSVRPAGSAELPGSRVGELLPALLAVRAAGTEALRREVVAALRAFRRDLRVILHGAPDPWTTGAAPGLTAAAADEVDAVVVPCWGTGPAVAADVRRVGAMPPGRAAAGAYVTVLPPVRAEEIAPHVRRLRAAGMTELDLYHLGLAGPARWPLLTAAIEAARTPSALSGAPPGS